MNWCDSILILVLTFASPFTAFIASLPDTESCLTEHDGLHIDGWLLWTLPRIGRRCRGNVTEAASKCTLRPSVPCWNEPCGALFVETSWCEIIQTGTDIGGFDLKSRCRELLRTYSARGSWGEFNVVHWYRPCVYAPYSVYYSSCRLINTNRFLCSIWAQAVSLDTWQNCYLHVCTCFSLWLLLTLAWVLLTECSLVLAKQHKKMAALVTIIL